MTSGKRKREDFPSEFGPDGYIPQQDGAGDVIADTFEVKLLGPYPIKCPHNSFCLLFFYHFWFFILVGLI